MEPNSLSFLAHSLARETRQEERFLFDRKEFRNLCLFERVTLRSKNRLSKQDVDGRGCVMDICKHTSTGIETTVADLYHCVLNGEDLLWNVPLFAFVAIALVMIGSFWFVVYYDLCCEGFLLSHLKSQGP